MKSKLHCIIIEDEPLAQQVLEKHLVEYPQLNLLGKFYNALDAFAFLASNEVDLMFVDIKMPGLRGTELARALKDPPAIVFTTAYQEHAHEAFELDALDYLLKPITPERFKKCIEKLEKILPSIRKPPEQFIRIKANGGLVKLLVSDVLFAEAMKDYIKLHLRKGSIITHMTMKSMEALLPSDQFIRVHRSFIVNANSIEKKNRSSVEVASKLIPIGELYKRKLEKWG